MSMERFVPVRAACAVRKLVRTPRTCGVSGVNMRLILFVSYVEHWYLRPIVITGDAALTAGDGIVVERRARGMQYSSRLIGYIRFGQHKQ